MQKNKENRQKLTHVGLVTYYKKLAKNERQQLKSYVAWFLHLSSNAVDNRMYERTQWSTAELIALQDVIDNEKWRQ